MFGDVEGWSCILLAIIDCYLGLVTAVLSYSPAAVQPLLDFYATPFRQASRLLHLFCGVGVLNNFRSFMHTRATFAHHFVVCLGGVSRLLHTPDSNCCTAQTSTFQKQFVEKCKLCGSFNFRKLYKINIKFDVFHANFNEHLPELHGMRRTFTENIKTFCNLLNFCQFPWTWPPEKKEDCSFWGSLTSMI